MEPVPGRILVVDDEPLIGEMVRRTLEDEHTVHVVRSAEEALALLASGQRFDAVVSDLQMPGLGGIGLHAALREREPGLAERTLFLTGGATSAASRAFLARKDVRFLDKPFRAVELTDAVARLLGQG